MQDKENNYATPTIMKKKTKCFCSDTFKSKFWRGKLFIRSKLIVGKVITPNPYGN